MHANYAKSAFVKLENEIKTHTISWNFVKTTSDNVYLMAVFVLFDLKNKFTCTRFRFHDNHILKASG